MIIIIETDGTTTLKSSKPISMGRLANWIGCDFPEKVNVFYEGKYEQMYVDESGAVNNRLPINKIATDIYHNNVRVHEPELLVDAANIHGVAVLLTGDDRLT